MSPTNPSSEHTQFESLSNIVNVWKSNLSAQITLLTTQIALELALRKSVDTAAREKFTDKLGDFKTEILSLLQFVTGFLNGTITIEGEVTQLNESLGLVQSDSQVNSNVDLKTSVSNLDANENTSSCNLLSEVICSRRESKKLERHFKSKLQSLLQILSNFRLKVEHLMDSGHLSDMNESFQWQSYLHYEWVSQEQKCVITSLGTRLDYGFQYTGSSPRIMITPQMEKTMYSLMRATDASRGGLLCGEEVCYVYAFMQ